MLDLILAILLFIFIFFVKMNKLDLIATVIIGMVIASVFGTGIQAEEGKILVVFTGALIWYPIKLTYITLKNKKDVEKNKDSYKYKELYDCIKKKENDRKLMIYELSKAYKKDVSELEKLTDEELIALDILNNHPQTSKNFNETCMQEEEIPF